MGKGRDKGGGGGAAAVQAECDKALLALKRGNVPKALRLIEDTVKRFESSAQARRVHLQISLKTDDRATKERNLRLALEAAAKGASSFPDSLEHTLVHAECLLSMSRYEEAVREANRGLSMQDVEQEETIEGLRAVIKKAGSSIWMGIPGIQGTLELLEERQQACLREKINKEYIKRIEQKRLQQHINAIVEGEKTENHRRRIESKILKKKENIEAAKEVSAQECNETWSQALEREQNHVDINGQTLNAALLKTATNDLKASTTKKKKKKNSVKSEVSTSNGGGGFSAMGCNHIGSDKGSRAEDFEMEHHDVEIDIEKLITSSLFVPDEPMENPEESTSNGDVTSDLVGTYQGYEPEGFEREHHPVEAVERQSNLASCVQGIVQDKAVPSAEGSTSNESKSSNEIGGQESEQINATISRAEDIQKEQGHLEAQEQELNAAASLEGIVLDTTASNVSRLRHRSISLRSKTRSSDWIDTRQQGRDEEFEGQKHHLEADDLIATSRLPGTVPDEAPINQDGNVTIISNPIEESENTTYRTKAREHHHVEVEERKPNATLLEPVTLCGPAATATGGDKRIKKKKKNSVQVRHLSEGSKSNSLAMSSKQNGTYQGSECSSKRETRAKDIERQQQGEEWKSNAPSVMQDSIQDKSGTAQRLATKELPLEDAAYELNKERACVLHPPELPSAISSMNPGLQNATGEFNCFLNVVIQSLWHIRRFRDVLLSTSKHAHRGDPCVACALKDIFRSLSACKKECVEPYDLRAALSSIYSDTNLFQEAQMNDASEVLMAILSCLHDTFGQKCSDGDSKHACVAHGVFGLDVLEQMKCRSCKMVTRRRKFTALFYNLNACMFRDAKARYWYSSMDEILKFMDMDDQHAYCDIEVGGCGRKNHFIQRLRAAPHVFTVVLGWQSDQESVEDISATVNALSTVVDLGVIYELREERKYKLVSLICFYGKHYECFAREAKLGWVMYSDATVKVIGMWEEVVKACCEGHLQPQVLFYEAIPSTNVHASKA